jgi:predicted  nucleic acid-binding Zn-ribbon protein
LFNGKALLVMPTDLLTTLISRLPELEWKMSSMDYAISNHSLPRGLFRVAVEPSASSCITEIKADIQALAEQKNERSAVYLAEQIRRKINVLVALCQVHSRKNKPEEKISFGVKMLSTRKQWVADLEAEIDTLVTQQQALSKTLEQMMTRHHNAAAILQLKADLGAIERRLTLAQETLSRAIS